LINKIAIIGLGSIGSRYLRILNSRFRDIEIIVVRSGKGSRSLEEKLANDVVYSIEESIEMGVQAAIISSPATDHLEQAIKLTKAGVHVLIEKPLSTSLNGIQELVKIINENKVIALVGYVLRYDPAANAFKNYIDSNILGDILSVNINCSSFLPDWRPGKDYKKSVSASKNLGGGVLLELSHELDYMSWFFGEIESTYGLLYNSKSLDIDVEESADLIIKSYLGYPISLHLDFNSRFSSRKCLVNGSKGSLVWDALEKTVLCRQVGHKQKIDRFEFERDDLFIKQINHFLDCVKNNSTPLVSVNDAIKTLELIEASRKSNELSKRVNL
jgi:predicted dehydrogenase